MSVRLQVALLLFPMTFAVAVGSAVAALLMVATTGGVLAALPVAAGAGTAVAAAAAWAVAGRLARRHARPALRVITGGKARSRQLVAKERPAARIVTGALEIQRRGKP